MVSTNSERKNSSTKNSLIINSETLGSGIENNNDTLLTNFDDGTLIQYGESIRHGKERVGGRGRKGDSGKKSEFF